MRNRSLALLTLALLCGPLAARAQDAAPDAGPAPADAPAPPAAAPDAPLAPAGAIAIRTPYNKATVRETVPVKLRDFPKGGYVSVSIDDRFVTAQALPASAAAPVFVWDTKAPYTTTDDPNTPRYYSDGTHALTLAVYDTSGRLVGRDSVSVQVANKINLPSGQGIRLSYPWKTGLSLRYQRRTVLSAAPSDAPTSSQTVQESVLRFHRTVENTTGGTFLIRDEIVPSDRSVRSAPFTSTVNNRGLVSPLGAQRARYREVDARGRVLSELESQNGVGSLGFPVPVLPPRRVSVGAHWETPVKLSLDWTGAAPATVTATSTLEDFEWQDRYPTAKIRETYSGPAFIPAGPGLALPPLPASDVKFERVIYFAYNAGRVVRTKTTLTLTSTVPGLLVAPSTLGGPGSGRGGSPYPGGGGPAPYPGGPAPYPGGPAPYPGGPAPYPGGPAPYPGGPAPYPGGGSPSEGGFPGEGGGSPGGGFGGGRGGSPYPGGSPSFPGGPAPYPGGQNGRGGFSGRGGGFGVDTTPTRLTYTETTVILI